MSGSTSVAIRHLAHRADSIQPSLRLKLERHLRVFGQPIQRQVRRLSTLENGELDVGCQEDKCVDPSDVVAFDAERFPQLSEAPDV